MGLLSNMKIIAVILIYLVYQVHGHGRLIHPAGRASMFKYGFPNPHNYLDHQMNCGGYEHQASLGGRCGLCGDPYDAPQPRDHEAGGRYANGIITASYKPGDIMVVRVELTATHDGWFEFRMCVNNDVNRPITQTCLDQHLLELADGSGTRYYLPDVFCPDNFTISLRLPRGVSCSQCVVQWKYNTGNRWGSEPDGSSCVGCGLQEQFYACSDIMIHPAVKTTPPFNTTYDAQSSCRECKGVGAWAGNRDHDRWCTGNCNHTPPNCPSTCECL